MWISLLYTLQKVCLCPCVKRLTINLNSYEALSEKYLVMPTHVGSSTNDTFKYLKDRVCKRVQGWMEQILSTGGKEVLIRGGHFF
jgi:hypothetical protein